MKRIAVLTSGGDAAGINAAVRALNIALESIDRLKVTASSHKRAFLVEVMGRNCGYLALIAGITGGAEVIVIPEVETNPEEVAAQLRGERGKAHAIAVVAEGARYNARALSVYFQEHKKRLGFELRVTTLGHVQRGGSLLEKTAGISAKIGYFRTTRTMMSLNASHSARHKPCDLIQLEGARSGRRRL